MSIASQEAGSLQTKSNGAAPADEGAVIAAVQDAAIASAGPASPQETVQIADSKPTSLTEKVRREAAALRNAFAFTQVVGVLMRSPHYRQYTIADLEWLVVPPVSAGQFRIGEVKPDKNKDIAFPVAVVLWASVSPEVDKRLMEADGPSAQLKPEEWTSGNIVWLVHAAGETRFVRHVVEQLTKTTFQGREVKILGRDQDGKSKVHVLTQNQPAPAA
jgi:hemolysin-activating ACP:hemolysin acyltransferase